MLLKKLLFVSCSLVIGNSSFGSNDLIGGRLTYEQLDSLKYRFYLELYQDCLLSTDTLPSDTLFIRLGASSVAALPNGIRTYSDASPKFASCTDTSVCDGGSFPRSIKKIRIVYEYTFSSSSSVCEHLVYSNTGEWGTGYAYPNVNGTPFFISTILNICTGVNSSPKILAPRVFSTKNVLTNLSFHAQDPDGDSLSYEPVVPLTKTGTLLIQVFPNMMVDSMHFNSYNGNVQFRPHLINAVDILGIRIKEWRKVSGVMQVIAVSYCYTRLEVLGLGSSPYYTLNYPPVLSLYEPGSPLQYRQVINSLCIGDTLKYAFNLYEDTSQSLTLNLLDTLPKGVNMYLDSSTFPYLLKLNWVTDSSMVNGKTFNLNFEIQDDACYVNQRAQYCWSFLFKHPPTGEISMADSGCGWIHAAKQHLAHVDMESWELYDTSFSDTLTVLSDSVHLSPGTWYSKYRLANSTCEMELWDTLVIPNHTEAHFLISDTSICQNDSLAIAVDDNKINATYHWSWNQQARITAAPRTVIQEQSNYWLRMQSVDINGCTFSDSVFVEVRRVPEFSLGPDTGLCGTAAFILSPDSSGNWDFRWSTGDSTQSLSVSQSGVYILQTQAQNQCLYSDSI